MSEHIQHEMHENSLLAHREERDAGKFSKRYKLVLDILANHQFSDRDIRERTPYQDMNAIRPRVTELIHMGILRECGSKVDPQTGKRVRIVERAPAVNGSTPTAFPW